jgi:amino acid transporter/nucleotide-binding universal stress UspA family protein
MSSRAARPIQVLIVGSVLFSFISYWRTAAIVLSDMASTAYYIGGIVEQNIGPAMPWFIFAVMLFSFLVSRVYLESCALFVRGGVYRIVKQAIGGTFAKLAVSALMFDYMLTGPISSVTAGQYIIGLVLETLKAINPQWQIDDPGMRLTVTRWSSVLIAIGITLYFFRQNIIGLHESSGKALKIMIATTVMGIILLVWCGITLGIRGVKPLPATPDLSPKVQHLVVKNAAGEDVWVKRPEGGFEPKLDPATGQPVPKINHVTGRQEDPMGFLGRWFPDAAKAIRTPGSWLSIIGLIGILIAFGHSLLAMSGMETMAQVYREVESPKLQNFRRAALIIFLFCLVLTGGMSFMAVQIIPDDVRMKNYSDNLISGLAMHVVGPQWALLLLNAFVVGIGALLLSGAVNTSMIGSNGVLNRVAEDGVIPSFLQKPHHKYGTTYRLLYVIVGLQIFTIIASQGDVLILGEAYAFGVVWSFTFNAFSMMVLRFKEKTPREAKVPLNIKFRGVELPIGLFFIFLILLATAVMNVLTKEVATISGLVFTAGFMTVFSITEYFNERARREREKHGGHLEQFTQQTAEALTPEGLMIDKHYRKLVAIRSPHNLHMLEKALEETDPDTTEVIVMTAKQMPAGQNQMLQDIDPYDQKLMTAVVQKAEKAGKHVIPLIVPTNNPLYAICTTARELGAQELIMGASNKYTAEEQLDQIALYWMNLNPAEVKPMTIRILGRNWDTHVDLGGGERIPTLRERKAKNVRELRAAGIGVDRVLMLHDGTQEAADLFEGVLTMLAEEVQLGLAVLPNGAPESSHQEDVDRAEQLERAVKVHKLKSKQTEEIHDLVRDERYDLLIVARPADLPPDELFALGVALSAESPCRVCIVSPPVVPREVEEDVPMVAPTPPEGDKPSA